MHLHGRHFLYREEAGVNMDGNFLIRFVYPDEITFRLVVAAEKILSEYTNIELLRLY